MSFKDHATAFSQESRGYAAHALDIITKQPKILDVSETVGRGLADAFQFGIRNRPAHLYSEFRNWVYAATNAIADRISGQPWMAAQVKRPKKNKAVYARNESYARQKSYLQRVPGYVRQKAPTLGSNIELYDEHPILEVLREPNPVQSGDDMLYMAAIGLLITGEAYFIGGKVEGSSDIEIWAIPTNWMSPIHKEGLFTQYALTFGGTLAQPVLLEKEQVLRLHMPNPTDFTLAYSPLEAIFDSAKTDTKIQRTQEDSFDTGLYPNVVISIGRLRNAEGQLTEARPILKGHQRRQIVRAVKQLWKQSVGQGDPAIIDGLIESIHKLQNTPQEMDYQNSSELIKKRILQAFRVNPIILGEVVGANRAQAVVADQHFCDSSVNPLANKISEGFDRWMTPWFEEKAKPKNGKPKPKTKPRKKLVIWIENCAPIDEDMVSREWTTARQNGDVTRDEFRAERLGLSALDELDEDEARSRLFDTPQAMAQVAALAEKVQSGALDREAAVHILMNFFEIEIEIADRMLPAIIDSDNPLLSGSGEIDQDAFSFGGGGGFGQFPPPPGQPALPAPQGQPQQPGFGAEEEDGGFGGLFGRSVKHHPGGHEHDQRLHGRRQGVSSAYRVAADKLEVADMVADAVHQSHGHREDYPGRDVVRQNWLDNMLGPDEILFDASPAFIKEIEAAAESLIDSEAFASIVAKHGEPLRVVAGTIPKGQRRAIAGEHKGGAAWVYEHPWQANFSQESPEPPDHDSLQHVIAHEYAHGVYDRMGVDAIRRWSQQYHAFEDDALKEGLSRYSRTNAIEGFCEALAVAVHPHYDASKFSEPIQRLIALALLLAKKGPEPVSEKHLPGQHDQSSHGRPQGGAAVESPQQALAENQAARDGLLSELKKLWEQRAHVFDDEGQIDRGIRRTQQQIIELHAERKRLEALL